MKRRQMALVVGAMIAVACGSDDGAGQPGRSSQPEVADARPRQASERPEAPADERFSRIPQDQVDQQRRAAAESFARSYEQARAQGTFTTLGDEATLEMRTSLTVARQEGSQQEIAATFGAFESLEYVEAWRANASPGSTIYRFRATFTKGKPEIRVVHDAAGKVSGFWLKPWRDSLEPPRPQKLPEDQVNTALRDASMAFAMSYLEQRKAGRFEVLGNQVTDELRAGLTPDVQQRSHAAITGEVGEYESLSYVETYRIRGEPDTTIFRFRGTFTKGSPEIRVAHDSDGKVSGFWIKPWEDRLD